MNYTPANLLKSTDLWINTFHGGKIVLVSLLILRFRLILKKYWFVSTNFENRRIGNYDR